MCVLPPIGRSGQLALAQNCSVSVPCLVVLFPLSAVCVWRARPYARQAETDAGRQLLQKEFHTCSPLRAKDANKGIDDGMDIVNWVGGPWGTMAMGNYPYSSSYVTTPLRPCATCTRVAKCASRCRPQPGQRRSCKPVVGSDTVAPLVFIHALARVRRLNRRVARPPFF